MRRPYERRAPRSSCWSTTGCSGLRRGGAARGRGPCVGASAAAVRAQGSADLLLVYHVLLGAPVGAASGLPYVVKAHGSELEFAMRGNAELCAWVGETLPGAAVVLAGSRHGSGGLGALVGGEPARGAG